MNAEVFMLLTQFLRRSLTESRSIDRLSQIIGRMIDRELNRDSEMKR